MEAHATPFRPSAYLKNVSHANNISKSPSSTLTKKTWFCTTRFCEGEGNVFRYMYFETLHGEFHVLISNFVEHHVVEHHFIKII